MGATGSGVLGFLIGILLAGSVAFALARTLLRLTGTRTAAGLLRFIGAGLLPGARRDGIAVQRSLANLLKQSYSVMASGRRVAASAIDVHVSPEDHRLISESIGATAAVADLTDFYVSYARESQWRMADDPVIRLRRDISLRPRQAYAQRTFRPPSADAGALAEERATADAGPADEQVTETIGPAIRWDGGPDGTRPYDFADTEVLGPGDLVVVHGTDVRTVPRERGRATIGSARHSDIVVDRPGVSREHATVALRDDGWWVEPKSGKNGTLLDGRPLVEPTRLPIDSTLGLGRGVKLRLTVEAVRSR
jgi:hypothetical protein